MLSIIEENHSYTQMRDQMPYLWSLAQQYGYATNWTALTHPSLPNYLAIVGGSTFGVTDDQEPFAHPIDAETVFDQALNVGKRARLWAESMPANCYLTNASRYGVRHNPWTYFTPSRARCNSYDVPARSFMTVAANNRLPAAGMLIPNGCNDGHDCSLATADGWLKARLPTVLGSDDFTSGRLVVVVTADEDDHS
ncbi:MAG: phosphoesterase, partial [Propionibacteriales bacterium]|nr:phosphoesterase [Propionibacteriales bacterium]